MTHEYSSLIAVPTPIQFLCLFNDNTIDIKRDDLTGFSFGGNKTRKAVLYFDELRKKGSDCVVTYGSAHSNHCRVIANLARLFGIGCHIVTTDNMSNQSINQQIVNSFGASYYVAATHEVAITIDKTIEALALQGLNPYFIPGGGHGNLGTHAYKLAYDEINILKNNYDYIFHATGTGTTQAGLIAGSCLDKQQHIPTIVGISVGRIKNHSEAVIKASIGKYLTAYYPDFELTHSAVVNVQDNLVPYKYGVYNQEVIQTVRQVFFDHGVALDPIYTGKAYLGMLRYIERENLKNKKILFVHTGSSPLFFESLIEGVL